MASKDINTVSNASTLTNNDYIFISKSGANLQKVKTDVFGDQLFASGTFFNNVAGNAAGAHNSIYRGKSLGTSFTSEQSSEITTGRFTDLFIGDYWTISGREYRIAAFDPFYRCGDNLSLGHHIAVVPSTFLYNGQIHSTSSGSYVSGNTNNIVTGGYADADMRTTNLAQATSVIEEDFGSSHVLSYRDLLSNNVGSINGYNNQSTNALWTDCKVELMSEIHVFGVATWGVSPYEASAYQCQFPLFRFAPDLIHIRSTYWLRNVVNGTSFSIVNSNGNVSYEATTYSRGVRPFALIG